MFEKLKLLFLLIVAIFAIKWSYSKAQDKPITLKQALEIAMENNPRIKSATAMLPITEAKVVIAKYLPNPKIGSFNEAVKGGSIHPGDLSTDVELGRKRYWRIRLAKEQVSKTELEIAKVVWEVHTQIHSAYAALVVGFQLYDLAKERTEFYESLFDVTEKRFSAGDVSKLELSRSRTELLRAQNQLHEVEGKLKQAKIDFNHLLGQDPNIDIALDKYEELKPKVKLHDHPDLNKIISDALAKRLEVAILEKDFGITRAQLKRAQWERVPNLSVEGGIIKPSLGTNVWGPYFGAQFEIPVFNRKQGEIKEARAQLEYLEKERNRIEQDIKAEVASAYKDIEVKEEQFHTYEEKLLSEAEDILDMVKYGYQKGKLSFVDVLDAEQRNREIHELYLENLYSYQAALASLEYAVGIPLYDYGEKL